MSETKGPKKPRPPKKPRGSLGTTTFRGVAGVEVDPVVLPDTQDEIERLMMEAFDRSLDKPTRDLFQITGFNKIAGKDDLDCWVRSKLGDFKMELTELVPVDIAAGGHDKASPMRSVAKTADKLLDRIEDKSASYRERRQPWLLIYVTSWQLAYLDNEITLVQRALLEWTPNLKRVYLLDVTNAASPSLTLIYPMPADREALVRSADVSRYCWSLGQLTMDPQSWKLVSAVGAVGEEQTTFESSTFKVP